MCLRVCVCNAMKWLMFFLFLWSRTVSKQMFTHALLCWPTIKNLFYDWRWLTHACIVDVRRVVSYKWKTKEKYENEKCMRNKCCSALLRTWPLSIEMMFSFRYDFRPTEFSMAQLVRTGEHSQCIFRFDKCHISIAWKYSFIAHRPIENNTYKFGSPMFN